MVEERVRSYFDAIAARDPDAMAEHWHADGVEDIVPLGVFRGPEAVRALFRETFDAMPDFQLRVVRVIADEDGAAVQWRARGTFTGSAFQGIEATGREIDLRGVDCLHIDEDGLITDNFAVYDGAAFARGVGLLPAQDSGAERAMRTGFNALTKLRRKLEARR